MSYHKPLVTQASSEPRRPLRADFTTQAMRRASVAKSRWARKQQLQTLVKELPSMKSLKFLRTAPGGALALAVLATGSMGAYALNNWFNGEVTVRQNDSILSVDLSSCKGGLPPGVDNPDQSNVQFKIMGNPHISVEDLQRQLLAECEFDAVLDFYRAKGQTDKYLVPATITATNGTSLTFEYLWGGEKHHKTLALATDATIYKESVAVLPGDLHVGAPIVIATSPIKNWQEGIDPLDYIAEAQSVFMTNQDINIAPNASKKGFYDQSNIMPLDQFNQIKH